MGPARGRYRVTIMSNPYLAAVAGIAVMGMCVQAAGRMWHRPVEDRLRDAPMGAVRAECCSRTRESA